jgi:hypothetical protein
MVPYVHQLEKNNLLPSTPLASLSHLQKNKRVGTLLQQNKGKRKKIWLLLVNKNKGENNTVLVG